MVAFFTNNNTKYKGSSLQTSRAGWGCPVKQNHTLYTILLLENFALKPKNINGKKFAKLKLQQTSHWFNERMKGRCQVLELIQLHFQFSFFTCPGALRTNGAVGGACFIATVTSFQCRRRRESHITAFSFGPGRKMLAENVS